MSKAIKSVGRAIKKVVSGIGKVIKKVVKSKFFKAIAIAAAIYFTGGAAAGLMSGAGAGAGLSAAASQLGVAGSALMGGNLSAAGSAIASGFSGIAPGAAAGLAEGAVAAGTAALPEVAGAAEIASGGTALGGGGGMVGGVAPAGVPGSSFGALSGAPSLTGAGLAQPAATTFNASSALGNTISSGAAGVGSGGAASGGFLDSIMAAGKTGADFMSANKLWTPALQMGGSVLSSASRQQQQLDEVKRQRQAIIDGYRSGFGQSMWR